MGLFPPLFYTSLFLFCGSALVAQKPNYAPPIKGQLRVTGTFGELRTNHFHAGVDLKSPTGTSVYSIGDGYVSRIKISPGGYGQAIYIDHPEGYRSVYGHLSALNEAFLDTVRAHQYAIEQFGVDLHFDALAFPVSKGERIGAVGNRGYSFGPHLHFEIRNSETDAPMNPLLFDLDIADTRRPDLRRLRIYELTSDGRTKRAQEVNLQATSNGVYVPASGQVSVGSSRIGLAIKAYDRQNAMPNYNGIYRAELWQDSTLLHAFQFDSLPFETTRYLNAHTDFAEWTENTSWFHRLYRLPGDQLDIYDHRARGGEIMVPDYQSTKVQIVVTDWEGNQSTAYVTLAHQPGEADDISKPYQYFLPYHEASIVDNGSMRLEVPAGALYTDCNLSYHQSSDLSDGIFSAVHHLHNPLTPLHLPVRIWLEPNQPIPPILESKLVVASCSGQDKPTSYGAALNNDGEPRGVAINTFGDFCLLLDTIAPTIESIDFRNALGQRKRFSFRITDNFATAGEASGLRYRATIDGQWVLMEYDLKRDLLYYNLAAPLSPGEHEFHLDVWDDRNNHREFRALLSP